MQSINGLPRRNGQLYNRNIHNEIESKKMFHFDTNEHKNNQVFRLNRQETA